MPDAAPNGGFTAFGGGNGKGAEEGKGSGGGWSEVAKKGGQGQDKGGEGKEAFKFVAGKRKGRR